MAGVPSGDYVLSTHVAGQMRRRGLGEDLLRRVLESPEQRIEVRPGREVFQARIRMEDPEKEYLVRVFVDVDRTPVEVVTAYRTSRVAKYWREAP